MSTTTKDYLSCAETAVMVREALKRHFPGYKFSVKSKNYAGGASITVSWVDGPASAKVDPIIKRFEGASFDGMIDLKSTHDDILVDAQGNMRTVHFGSDYVFAQRKTSDELMAAVLANMQARYEPKSWATLAARHDHEMFAWRAISQLDIPKGQAVEVTAKFAADIHFGSSS